MKTVWKSVLPGVGLQEIEVPSGAQFLHAAAQGNNLTVWYLCDPAVEKVKAKLFVSGTGTEAPEIGNHIGTALMPSGLVWHVFFMYLYQ